MTEIFDGRQAAWSNAWRCVESAQEARVKAFRTESERVGNASPEDELWLRQSSTLYNALMREAEVFTALAHAPADVGVYAGTFIRDYERRKSEQSEFISRVMDGRNECADCGAKLTSDNRMQIHDGAERKTIYVCGEHYAERIKGSDDAEG